MHKYLWYLDGDLVNTIENKKWSTLYRTWKELVNTAIRTKEINILLLKIGKCNQSTKIIKADKQKKYDKIYRQRVKSAFMIESKILIYKRIIVIA